MAIQEKAFFVSNEMCQGAAQKTSRIAYIHDEGSYRGCEKAAKLVGAQVGIMGLTAALGTGGCAGAGALIGLAGGPAAPISIPICAAIGAGVGLVVSAIAGPVIVAELPCAGNMGQDYKEWKQEIVQTELLSEIKKQYGNDPLFESIQDDIDYDFFDTPVKAPCGHTFERTRILQHLKANEMCPSCRVPIKEEQLTIDYLMIGKTRKVFASLLERETKNPQLSVKSATDLSHIAHSLNQQAKHCFLNESSSLDEQLRQNCITAAAYAKRRVELMELIT